MENLEGYREDVKSICNNFLLFGYDIRVYADLDAQELRQTVIHLAKERRNNNSKQVSGDDSIFKYYASLVIWILSYHGKLCTVYGHDGEQVSVRELEWALSFEKCPELKDKPKIFFIQGHRQKQQTTTSDNNDRTQQT